jgi:hypothetical protein
MQTAIFLTKLSDESIIFISDVGKNSRSTLLYEFYKTLDCDTSWLGHDERGEECQSLIKRM